MKDASYPSLFNDDDIVRCGYVRGDEVVFVDNGDEWLEYISSGGCGWQLQRPTHGPLAGWVIATDELGARAYMAVANEATDEEAILALWASQ